MKKDIFHAASTDEIELLVAGRGNPIPEIVVSFLGGAFFFLFGLFLLLGDIRISPELFGSQTASKIIAFVIMLLISCFYLLYAIALCKRAKIYYCKKREFENCPVDETVEDKIKQRTCPRCGDIHDIDYPQCPKCRFKFF